MYFSLSICLLKQQTKNTTQSYTFHRTYCYVHFQMFDFLTYLLLMQSPVIFELENNCLNVGTENRLIKSFRTVLRRIPAERHNIVDSIHASRC